MPPRTRVRVMRVIRVSVSQCNSVGEDVPVHDGKWGFVVFEEGVGEEYKDEFRHA